MSPTPAPHTNGTVAIDLAEVLPSATSTHHAAFKFATRALHVGSEPSLSASSGVNPALELSTTFQQSKVGKHKGFEYTRSSNPTRLALERVLASLEGADVLLEDQLRKEGRLESWDGGPAALAFSSGSAATATVVGGLVGQGGHILSVADVYGGTSRYMVQVASMLQGAETTFVDMSYGLGKDVKGETEAQRSEREDAEIVKRVEDAIRPNTKLIWAETPTNPLLSLVPIELISRVAKAHKIPFVVDNTFASPYWQNPLLLGADVVIHSLTKYMNGHSDVLGGAVISHSPVLLPGFRFLQNAHGAVPSPFDCFLTIRGIKTLSLRARQHGLNGLTIARWLDTVGVKEGLVRDVRYPGLNRLACETSGQKRERELAWKQMSVEGRAWCEKQGFSRDGAQGFPSGGMVSFHIVSPAEASQFETGTAESFLEALQLFTLAESLGGVESLAELPLLMTHAGVAEARRKELGIDGELIRLSVGVEDVDDLVADVAQALRLASKHPEPEEDPERIEDERLLECSKLVDADPA